MDKRYQIFISSTFVDLEDERWKVMKTILDFDCIPTGMELFPAMDEEQFKYIKRIIDDSDYFLLIIGGRYGSVDKDGVSWTEKEYDYAVEKGIPVMVFDHKDFTQLQAKKTDQDDKKKRKLFKFKKKAAGGKLINYWTNADDLALAVATSLRSVLKLQPRIGWVRADKNLIRKIDKLQKQIDKLSNQILKKDDEIKKLRALVQNKKEQNQPAMHHMTDAIIERRKKLEDIRESVAASSVCAQSFPFTVEGVTFNMIRVKGGIFMMGANDDDTQALEREKPAHEVTLSDFYIGETQVTQALWEAVMGANHNHSYFTGSNRPVENVSWTDCQKFIVKLNKKMKEMGKSGIEFRFPTEAEWEFAARGGNLEPKGGSRYAGGQRIDSIFQLGWFSENSENTTHPVGELGHNELGLYDMSGNVWEWCADWYDDYSKEAQNNPQGPPSGAHRVNRGGGWNGQERYCRVSDRFDGAMIHAGYDLGLRLALSDHSDLNNEKDI